MAARKKAAKKKAKAKAKGNYMKESYAYKSARGAMKAKPAPGKAKSTKKMDQLHPVDKAIVNVAAAVTKYGRYDSQESARKALVNRPGAYTKKPGGRIMQNEKTRKAARDRKRSKKTEAYIKTRSPAEQKRIRKRQVISDRAFGRGKK
jgi:GH24 family phage-related lysozyme (muramidase)